MARAYDQWAPTYDSDHNATRDLDARILRARGLPVSGARVLEIGCGTGKNTVWLAEHALSVVAMDFSPEMVARARARTVTHHVQFVQHDVRVRWPLADGAYDVVIGTLVLEHVEGLAPVFAEAARVLAPGGTVYCSELHPYRQRHGSQAHFSAGGVVEPMYVPAYPHSVSDFVNAGVAAGLVLSHLGEWIEDDAQQDALWRLLTLQFTKPPAPR